MKIRVIMNSISQSLVHIRDNVCKMFSQEACVAALPLLMHGKPWRFQTTAKTAEVEREVGKLPRRLK